ncbi:MAG: energy transducer TonB [Pseudomonadota bacterium]
MRATGKFVAALVAGFAVASGAFAADPVWTRTPTADDFSAVFPRDGERLVEGLAQLRCAVAADHTLADCLVASESPEGKGVGAAALSLAPKFQVTPEAASKLVGGRISVPIRFREALPSPPPRMARFKTMSAYAHLGDAGPYYPDRAVRAGVTGVVLMDCVVLASGRLDKCETAAVSPRDFGFEHADAKMAEQGWMMAGEPILQGATPVDGVWRFRVEFAGRKRAR